MRASQGAPTPTTSQTMQLFAAIAFAIQASAIPVQTAELRGEELMKALRSGGYTVLLRHARTDRSVQEPMGAVPAERSAQRNLSANGVRDATLMGVVFRKYGIPFGEIVSSPMFRARETAEFAAGPPTITMALRVIPSTDEQAALVAMAPNPNTNRLLVTHHFVIERHVPGIGPGEIAESEAAIVKPTGDGRVTLVGRITLGDWESLAGVVAGMVAGAVAGPAPSASPTPSLPTAHATTASRASGVSIPDTRAGRLAARYIAAFNSGDSVPMRAFIESSLLLDPERPAAARLATYAAMFRDFGPLTVTGVHQSADEEITLAIRAKAGDFFLTAKASREQPGRATSITIGTGKGGHP